jgi:hypothetical protein
MPQRHALRLALCTSIALVSSAASAGLIATENLKTGYAGSWTVGDDGSAASDGVVDVYPGEWSIKPGDALHFKVRSTAGYDVRIFRLGWYGGRGATEVKLASGNAADPQPYPTTDATYGMAEANWHVSVTIADTAAWTPGVYAARIERADGKQAETIFVVRDDLLAAKLPVLFVIPTNTHQAYNCWPGPGKTGKSLYGFNSSATHPTSALSGLTQATKVSYDRPFFVGGGTADITRYEYPFLRWLEKQGTWDVAYATDLDLHANPGILSGRKMFMTAGHAEYWSRAMFDNATAARDAGVNMLFASGDTISWQVRFEAGSAGSLSTVVGYKESYPKDPEQLAGEAAKASGDIAGAISHYQWVTRPWKRLEYDTTTSPVIDLRRPGMILTGVQSSGVIRDIYGAGKPDYNVDSKGGTEIGWGDFSVSLSTHWLFAGTGMVAGSRIKSVMGYEVDSTLIGSTEFDPFRPAGQMRLGTIYEVSDGAPKGAMGFYRAASGAEVIGIGAIAWSWALDDYALGALPGVPSTVDPNAQTMMTNVFNRWTAAVAPPPFDAGVEPDAAPDPEAGPTEIDATADVPVGDVAIDGVVADAGADATDATTAPDATTTDTATGSDVATGGDTATTPDAPGGDTSVVVDSTTGADAGEDTGIVTPPVEDSSSSCSCSVPGRERDDQTVLTAIGVAAIALGIGARRRRRVG